jgi:hypothetical protein
LWLKLGRAKRALEYEAGVRSSEAPLQRKLTASAEAVELLVVVVHGGLQQSLCIVAHRKN